MNDKTNDMEFMKKICRWKPFQLQRFLSLYLNQLIISERPFADYMRQKFKEKNMMQQEIFLAADIPERYGYKLISEEKHTTQRDTVLRICMAAKFNLEEIQEALTLYGMAPLHCRIPRDIVFIVAISNQIYDIHDVDALLRENYLPPLLNDEPAE